jgi:hypothetical protein
MERKRKPRTERDCGRERERQGRLRAEKKKIMFRWLTFPFRQRFRITANGKVSVRKKERRKKSRKIYGNNNKERKKSCVLNLIYFHFNEN